MGDSSGELFLEGEGDASLLLVDFFFVDEVEVAPPSDFLVVEVDFFVDAVVECVVVAAVSSLWAQDATKAAPTRMVVNPRTNFFIS